jgi:hypothetical protein
MNRWYKFAIGLALLGLTCLAIIHFFGGKILNGPIRTRVEKGYAKTHPGKSLQLGRLSYSFSQNRLHIQSVRLRSVDREILLGPSSFKGVHWLKQVFKTSSLYGVCRDAVIDIEGISLGFPSSSYRFQCAGLRASVPESTLLLEDCQLKPFEEDQAFFAGNPYRMTRFDLIIPRCQVTGLSYASWLEKKGFVAAMIEIIQPSLNALANLEKPNNPGSSPPLMVPEALAALKRPLKIETVRITDGLLQYGERLTEKGPPGVVSLGGLEMSIGGIQSEGVEAESALSLTARGNLMNAGILSVQMTIPLRLEDFTLHASGSLGTMDLTSLNAFLEHVEHIRVTSGQAHKVVFEFDVAHGWANGFVRAGYENLRIAILDKKNNNPKGLATFFARLFKIRSGSARDVPGESIDGVVRYRRSPDHTFLQFVWFSLRSGVMDIVKR